MANARIYKQPAYQNAKSDVKMALSGAAKKHGVDEPLIMAMAQMESGFRPDAVSPVGAVGTIQVMPATAEGIAKQRGISQYDMKDPKQNADFGAFLLRQNLNKYKDNPYLATAAYNAGTADVDAMIAKWRDRNPGQNGDWSDLSKVSAEQVLKGLSTWKRDPNNPNKPPETYRYVNGISSLI
jgi:soluble lytic murein transglycosylase-like protein